MSGKNDQALDDYFSSLFFEAIAAPVEVEPTDAPSTAASARDAMETPLAEDTSVYQPSHRIEYIEEFSRRPKPLAELLNQTHQSKALPFAEPPQQLPEVLPTIHSEIIEPQVQDAIASETMSHHEELAEVKIEMLPEPDVTEPEVFHTDEPLIEEVIHDEISESVELSTEIENSAPVWHNIDVESSFQALFFEVAGITYAVPLSHLGGIHRITHIASLFGKPKWFAGIMTQREEKFNAVDLAKWVMPAEDWQLNYQYMVMLANSRWGLCCEKLNGTEWLNQDDVKWRQSPGKRPWLAGMIKKKMCALIHVEEFIHLLEQGLDIDGN